MSESCVVGIDLSLSCTAIVKVGTKTGKVLFQETNIGKSLKRGPTWWDRQERIEYIMGKLKAAMCGEKIDSLVFEGPSLGSKGATLFYIGELMGDFTRRLNSIQVEREIVEVPPSCLKKFATGKGNAPKPLIAAHVQKRWDVIFGDDNLTDAYVLCQVGRALLGMLKGMPKVNNAGLDKVLRYVKDSGRDKN